MATYMLMTRLGPAALESSEGRKAMGKSWLKKVKKRVPGVKFKTHYAIFGPYDFMDIFEAETPEAAQRVALISRCEGAASVETWQAVPYPQFLEMLDKVD